MVSWQESPADETVQLPIRSGRASGAPLPAGLAAAVWTGAVEPAAGGVREPEVPVAEPAGAEPGLSAARPGAVDGGAAGAGVVMDGGAAKGAAVTWPAGAAGSGAGATAT